MDQDLQIIRRVLAGEVEAFRVLVDCYRKPLFCFLGNLVRDANDCDDLAQDTFLAAYQNLGSYVPGKARFVTWLLTIARNKYVNAMQKRRPLVAENQPPPIDPRDPAERLIESEFFVRLDRALAALPCEQKTVFVLAEIEGLSHEEICQIEGVLLGTVKSRLSRAKEKLRSAFPASPETCR